MCMPQSTYNWPEFCLCSYLPLKKIDVHSGIVMSRIAWSTAKNGPGLLCSKCSHADFGTSRATKSASGQITVIAAWTHSDWHFCYLHSGDSWSLENFKQLWEAIEAFEEGISFFNCAKSHFPHTIYVLITTASLHGQNFINSSFSPWYEALLMNPFLSDLICIQLCFQRIKIGILSYISS